MFGYKRPTRNEQPLFDYAFDEVATSRSVIIRVCPSNRRGRV